MTDVRACRDDLRYVDLLAKTAKTSFKDTQSVLLAIEVLREAMQLAPTAPAPGPLPKPTEREVLACDRAHRRLLEHADTRPLVRAWIETLRELKRPVPSTHADRRFPR